MDATPRVLFSDLINGAFALASKYPRPVAAFVVLTAGIEAASDLSGFKSVSLWPILLVWVFAQYFLLEFVLEAEGMRSGQSRGSGIGAYIGVSILVSLAGLFGLVAFILPGLILFGRWFVAIPLAVAGERSVFTAMRESWEMTRRSQWALVGFIALYMLIAFTGVGMLGELGSVREYANGTRGLFGMISGLVGLIAGQTLSALSALASVVALRALPEQGERISEIFS
jgi:hypothetical protein